MEKIDSETYPSDFKYCANCVAFKNDEEQKRYCEIFKKQVNFQDGQECNLYEQIEKPYSRDEVFTFDKEKLSFDLASHLTKAKALAFAELLNKINPYFFYNGLCYIYDFERHCWQPHASEAEIHLLGMIKKYVPSVIDAPETKQRKIFKALKVEGINNCKVLRIREQEQDNIKLVQFKNKIIDIDTGESIQMKPTVFTVSAIPHEMGVMDDTPTMDALFKSWVGEGNERILYEILAYCMLPCQPLHRIFFLLGSGSNGKSTYLKILRKFIGIENCTTATFHWLVNSRFESSKLFKKLVCINGEENFKDIDDTGILKALTGEDAIAAEFKGVTGFNFVNYAKLVIACNTLPRTSDKTDAWKRRQCVIEFTGKFLEGKNFISKVEDTIPEEEYENLARKSIRLLKEVLKRESFSGEGSLQERGEKYEKRSDPIIAFIKDNCEESPSDFVAFWELRNRIEAYLDAQGYRKMSDFAISQRLVEQGFEADRQYYYDNNGDRKQYRIYHGLKFKTIRSEDKGDRVGNGLSSEIKDAVGTEGTKVTEHDSLLTIDNERERGKGDIGGLSPSPPSPEPNPSRFKPDLMTNLPKFGKVGDALEKDTRDIISEQLYWSETHLVWHNCATCGDVPCNFQDNGKPYCQKHFSSGK
jgi:P4 family phage/plasmid primase-like protien